MNEEYFNDLNKGRIPLSLQRTANLYPNKLTYVCLFIHVCFHSCSCLLFMFVYLIYSCLFISFIHVFMIVHVCFILPFSFVSHAKYVFPAISFLFFHSFLFVPTKILCFFFFLFSIFVEDLLVVLQLHPVLCLFVCFLVHSCLFSFIHVSFDLVFMYFSLFMFLWYSFMFYFIHSCFLFFIHSCFLFFIPFIHVFLLAQ